MKTDTPFWEDGKGEDEGIKMGSSFPPVSLFLDMVEISTINAKEPLVKTVILSDGKELDIHIMLNTDRGEFNRSLREAIDEVEGGAGS